MQSIADRQIVTGDLEIEIRSRWSQMPASAPTTELQRLGLRLLEGSRVLRLTGATGALEPHHLEALIDPLAERASIGRGPASRCQANDLPPDPYVDVFCRPGVTDAEGETAALALRWAGMPGVRCRAGLRYRFAAEVPPASRAAAERLLGNSLIHSFAWSDEGSATRPTEEGITGDQPAVDPAGEIDPVSVIDLRGCDDEELLEISRRLHLALDLREMQAIAGQYRSLGRGPTDVELQSLALTWSEHCSHKTFKATIQFEHNGRREIISGLLQSCIVEPTAVLNRPWVRSAFVDNAGVIAFDAGHDLAFKVETHNHPSALEPFGGAHTGVGGVIRDILAVSAEPIANTDVLCFGPLDGAAPSVSEAHDPRTIYRGVVRGIADYGNNMGIPTVGGAILFHPGYTANPLVYCGTLGLAPAGSHPRNPRPGDAVVLLGGRTGRDGLHGATMSSETLDRNSVAGSAVQIGAPITEKLLCDVLPHLRDERLYHAITDCGAGGLCSAIGEMGEEAGVEVDLALVPLKYEGLRPWEIWLSEAQERMVLAVPPDSLPRLFALCGQYDVEATVLGRFRGDGLLRLWYGSRQVADLPMAFLHRGRPHRTLEARWTDRQRAAGLPPPSRREDASATLLRLLSHPNIASKESVIRQYDHEVQGSTVLKPLVGRSGPSDAAVLKPLPHSWRGAVVAHGINPLYTAIDPHAMAMLAVDEALRNLVCAGGSIERAALLDNFCWGDVDDPQELGALVRAVQGCRDAALSYRIPFISGKDSLRNTSVDGRGAPSGGYPLGASGCRSIPGTLLISAVGVVPDVRRGTSMDLKAAGSAIYLLGLTTGELGGSHYLEEDGRTDVPRVRPRETRTVMKRLTRAIRGGLVASCHDLSEGGLAVATAEMAFAGGLGMEIDLDRVPAETDSVEALLFAESPGRFLIEVAEERCVEVERLMRGLPYARLGKTTSEPRFAVRRGPDRVIDLPLTEIDRAWRTEPGTLRVTPPDTRRVPAAWVTPPRAERPVGAPTDSSHAEERAGWTRRGAGGRGGKPRALVLAAPGVNCDRETVEACWLAGAEVELVHLNQLLSRERRIGDFGMVVLPGGFSYGDHLGAGSMLATVLRHRFLEDLHRFIEDGRPLLGICNGFQVLARLGLLGEVTLVPNLSDGVPGRFVCRWVRLCVQPSPCLFLRGLERHPEVTRLELPVAHGQGRLVLPGEGTQDHQSGARPLAPLRYEDNPNGSMGDIAGICNPAGNVFGLMPHPERYLTRYHHPGGRTIKTSLPPLGLTLFRNAVCYVREAL